MPMGLKNAPAIFQRIMEQVLKDLPFADPYIDDVIIGSTGATVEETIENHFQDLKKVLETLEKADIVVSTKKMQLFMKEVEFCGHILSEGKRRPAPGKLMAVQKWELPRVVTKLFWIFGFGELLF